MQDAIDNYGKPEIFNTDQGSQFTSNAFINIWGENNLNDVKISMDGRGRATDNAFIERLWRSVKQENIYRNKYEDGILLWLGISNYFNYYNTERQHQSLNYKTPKSVYQNEKQNLLPLNSEPENTISLCL